MFARALLSFVLIASLPLLGLAQAPFIRIDGPQGLFAAYVDIADFNQDGVQDLLLSDSVAGIAFIYSGADQSVLQSFPLVFAQSVAFLEDIDGDGTIDVAVGNGGFGPNNGVRVFSGATGTTIYDILPSAGISQFGVEIALIHDFNGDGTRDLLIGAPQDINDRGHAYIHSGANGGLLHTSSGQVNFERHGFSVAATGDIDGDGIDDMIIGSEGTSNGRVRVLSGSDGSVIWSFGPASEFDFGVAVGDAGDFDGDGRSDFFFTHRGSQKGRFRVVSGATGQNLFVVRGTDFGTPHHRSGSLPNGRRQPRWRRRLRGGGG